MSNLAFISCSLAALLISAAGITQLESGLTVPPMPPDLPMEDLGPELVPITLAWDPSPDAGVAHYRLHYGDQVTNVGTSTQASLKVSLGTTLTYYVTAVGTNQLESDPSNSIQATPRWESSVTFGTRLLVANSLGGPWTHPGTNHLRVSPSQAASMWAKAQVTAEHRRWLSYE
jgi:hypothetical protein